MKKPKPVPIPGKHYHFFDDGKTSDSRHYIAKCVEIKTKEEAKNTFFELHFQDEGTGKLVPYKISLFDRWKQEKSNYDWLYAEDTEVIVGCLCPEYDDNELWFVRDKQGGWFSINVQSWWQTGELDVDNSTYNFLVKEHKRLGTELSYTYKLEDYKDDKL